MANSNTERESAMEAGKKREIFRQLRRPFADMRADEDDFGYFQRTGRFADYVLTGSAMVELFIHETILKVYNLTRRDKRSDQLLSNLSLHRELQTLYNLGTITAAEFRVLDAFRIDRNRLIHNLELTRFFSLTKDMKDKHMKVIRDALDVVGKVLFRVNAPKVHPTKVDNYGKGEKSV